MKKISIIFLLLSFQQLSARTFYFSDLSGNDDYTFYQAQNISTPWKTIDQLNKYFNQFQPGDSILFKRGETFFGTINITKSGTVTMPIILSSYGTGNRPVITGLKNITNWISIGNGLYESVLNTAPTNSLNIITFQDTLQPIGRYPKANMGEKSYLSIKSHLGNTVINSDGVTAVPDFTGAELVQRSMQWVFDRSIVLNQTQTQLTTKPEVSPDHPSYTYESMNGHGFFFQNHIKTLTNLGDWSYDQNLKKLTMFFGNNDPKNYSVKASCIDNIINLAYQQYIKIQNLNLTGANEFIIAMDNSAYCTMDQDELHYAGKNAIDVNMYSDFLNTHHNTLSNSSITNVLNNGLNLLGSTNWRISNNHISQIGMIQGMGLSGDAQTIGIMRVGARSIIEYNEIDSVGYHGVWFTGDSVIIRYNHVHHCMMKKSDGGGIYTYGATGVGRVVYNNIIHDNYADIYGIGITDFTNPYSRQAHGIYNDGNSSNITETNNTCFNNSQSGIWFGSTENITATGNVCYNNTTAQIKGIDDKGIIKNVKITNNILFARDSGQLVMSFVFNNAVSMTGLNTDSNVYARPIWQPSGIDANNGYGVSPFKWNNYNDGAIIENASNYGFYSLDAWQKSKYKDLHTLKAPASISTINDVYFAYNAGNQVSQVTLNQNYLDMNGVRFPSGQISLQPYSSILLLRDTAHYLHTLPVTITSFNGYLKNKEVILEWNTTHEINVSQYVVERSVDGNNFQNLGTVGAFGSLKYNYSDNFPVIGDNFYRLKIYDKDGTFTYSSILKENYNIEMVNSISVFPNPVINNTINVHLDNIPAGQYSLTLVNKLGQLVYKKQLNHLGGSVTNSIQIEEKLAKGVYYLQLNNYRVQVIIV